MDRVPPDKRCKKVRKLTASKTCPENQDSKIRSSFEQGGAASSSTRTRFQILPQTLIFIDFLIKRAMIFWTFLNLVTGPEGRARMHCKASPPKAKRKTTMMVAEAPKRAPRCKARLLADAQHLHHKTDTHMRQVEGEHSQEAPPGSSGCRHHSRCDTGTAPPDIPLEV